MLDFLEIIPFASICYNAFIDELEQYNREVTIQDPSPPAVALPCAVWSVGLPAAAPRTTQHKFLRSAAGAEESRESNLNSYTERYNTYALHLHNQ